MLFELDCGAAEAHCEPTSIVDDSWVPLAVVSRVGRDASEIEELATSVSCFVFRASFPSARPDITSPSRKITARPAELPVELPVVRSIIEAPLVQNIVFNPRPKLSPGGA